MKLLVIGIDGGTKTIIEGMPMPFTQSLIAGANSRELDEDLISRGWAEILTGEHASGNKAFYLMPCADGTYDFSASYSKADMVSASTAPPLWKKLNDLGASVGLLNIPTTGPADEVDGFLVAGGGGGLKPGGAVPPGMVYPESLTDILQSQGYVFDIRLPGGAHTVPDFFRKITEAEEIQKNTFIDLADRTSPDFGFHCFRITTEVQYLARYEIERCIENIQKCREQGAQFEPENPVQESLISHYKHLDNNIRELFGRLEPENYLLVGDHSTALFEFEGNIDVWLEESGYLSRMSDAAAFLLRLKRFIRRKVQHYTGLGSSAHKPTGTLIRKPITWFSKSRTKAFGTFYDTGNFAGIFINDSDRFGGPVRNEAAANRLVGEICDRLNRDPVASKHGITAKPYRAQYKDAPFQKLMPDIKIHKPDTIYFSSRRWAFVTENPNLKPLDESLSGIRYPHSGAKGSNPLFVYNKALEPLFKEDDPNDLRVAYRVICRLFGNEKEARDTSPE
jgi:predicted AlkP superfamily phosphohydrolase/phosphomutase